jgi:hypothetical protein
MRALSRVVAGRSTAAMSDEAQKVEPAPSVRRSDRVDRGRQISIGAVGYEGTGIVLPG